MVEILSESSLLNLGSSVG